MAAGTLKDVLAFDTSDGVPDVFRTLKLQAFSAVVRPLYYIFTLAISMYVPVAPIVISGSMVPKSTLAYVVVGAYTVPEEYAA